MAKPTNTQAQEVSRMIQELIDSGEITRDDKGGLHSTPKNLRDSKEPSKPIQ